MELIPQQSRIVVELIEDSNYGGIELPDNMEKPDYARCKVVAIGSGRTLENGTVIPVPLEIGDEVVFDARFAAKLEPKCIYEQRNLAVIDYAGVLCTVKRTKGEPLYTAPPRQIARVREPFIVQ